MKRFSLFKKKNSRVAFEYTPDLTEYRIFPDQPPSVKTLYHLCKISMAVCIPFFSLIAFFSFLAALFGLVMLFMITFNKIYQKYGLKAAFVPLICSATGILFGSVFFRYLLIPKEVF
jgi:hypothetical protein